MIQVAALTSGKFAPSARFRVRQHIEPLGEWGVEVREYTPAIDKYAQLPGRAYRGRPEYFNPGYYLWQGVKLATRLPGLAGSRRSQVTWLERNFLDGALTLEPLVKRPLVFDVDDAIFLMPPWGAGAARWTARRAEMVIAGNQYLADWFSRYAREVRIVPTAVDTARFRPRAPSEARPRGRFVVGWTGLASNLPYLYDIEVPLGHFLQKFPEAEILVVADAPPRFCTLPSRQVRYFPWSPQVEAQAVGEMDVGLMPLPETDWTRGKCSYKMLQYMAAGLPVVVSPVGMNAEVLALGDLGLPAVKADDWFEALVYFYENRELAQAWGQKGREVVLAHFSREVVTPQLARIFRELA